MVGLATACGSSQAAGTIYAPREVQAAFHAALGFPVYEVPMSQRPGEVMVFNTQGSHPVRFDLIIAVYRSSSAAVAAWKFEAASLRFSGYAGQRLENVIATAARPGSQIGIRGKHFVMPAVVVKTLKALSMRHS